MITFWKLRFLKVWVIEWYSYIQDLFIAFESITYSENALFEMMVFIGQGIKHLILKRKLRKALSISRCNKKTATIPNQQPLTCETRWMSSFKISWNFMNMNASWCLIVKATIRPLFVIFPIIIKGTVFENFTVPTSKKFTYFRLASLFYRIISNNVRDRLKATNDSEFYSYFPGQTFKTTTKTWTFCVDRLLNGWNIHSFATLLQ